MGQTLDGCKTIVSAIDGSLDIEIASGKYLKLWQGPQHPGITGNMSVELTVCGDEMVEGKTHVGYLHRGFELHQRLSWEGNRRLLRERVQPTLCPAGPLYPGFSPERPGTRALAPLATSASPAAAC
jgi:hypothetical protein